MTKTKPEKKQERKAGVMLSRIMESLGISNKELVSLGIHRSQLTRWGKGAFPVSTEILFNLFIKEIEHLKKENK